LKAVFHAAGSVKAVVTPELWRRGIRVSGAAEVLGRGVAETALGMTISSLKHMWRLSGNTRSGEWAKDRDKVKELFGINVGVIGAGRAGRHYIRLLNSFEVDILLYDPTISFEKAAELGAKKVELEELLRTSDVVSIHAPSIPATNRMINRERLAIMKDDAILINTARGTIIDEDALAAELGKGRLFACLDVTDPEPPSKDHPFRSLQNVILTPHIAGAVNNGQYRIGKYAVEEIKRFVKGQPMDGEVKEEQLGILA
jgi:phosphoglycerate dehydrogenase-like enzyme